MKLSKEVRLRLDEFSGEGGILLAEGWEDKDALLRADIVKDWIGELAWLYSDALIEMGQKNATGVQFIELTDDYFQLVSGDDYA